MRRLVPLVASACAAMLAGAAQPPPRATTAQPVVIDAERVALNPTDPAQTRVGALTYAWGVQLKARGTSRFGGLSGLEVRARHRAAGSARTFTAVSDAGDVFRFDSPDDGPPGGRGLIRALVGTDRQPLAGKTEGDAESMAGTKDGYVVGFEGRHRVWAYERPRGRGDLDLFGAAPAALPPPPIADLPGNEGFEALAVLPSPGGDRLAVGAEDGRVWLCTRQGRCSALLPRGGPAFAYRLTGLDHLPGTQDLVAVYRFFNPFTLETRAIVAYLPIRNGRTRIVPLATLARPLTVDNFEGVSALPHGRGWRLYLVSDDNFAPHQRTLLLALDWRPHEKGPASPPAPRR